LPVVVPRRDSNVVVRWNNAVLQGVRDSKLGPPMVARALAIVHTCVYDAWAAYDKDAIGTRLGGSLRRPADERTLESKSAAISFAAYRAALDLFPGSKATVFDRLLQELGYDPGDTATDGSAAGIGNVAANAVLDFRHRDGAISLEMSPAARPEFRTPTTQASSQRTSRWTCAPRSMSAPSTIPTRGSRSATSTAPERSSRRRSSARNSSA
jgi:hypothetical protein